jgi:hypothetical protein
MTGIRVEELVGTAPNARAFTVANVELNSLKC